MRSDAPPRTKILGWFFAVIWTIDPVVSSCVSYERCLDAEQGIPSGILHTFVSIDCHWTLAPSYAQAADKCVHETVDLLGGWRTLRL